MALDRRLVRAPAFPPVEWLNAESAPTLAGLRGHPVLIEFWDFTCINCLRTLPYLRDWTDRYHPAGLRVLGVHTPEFRFARSARHVREAIGRLGIVWPVALDNDQATWTAFATRAWPTLVLVDGDGYVRFRHVGDRSLPEFERLIRALITETGGPDLDMPVAAGSLLPQDAAGAVCLPATAELQVDSIGNGPASESEATTFAVPSQRTDGRFYLEGSWRRRDDGLTLEAGAGAIILPFHAAAVHAVLSSGGDLETDPQQTMRAEATLDGHPIQEGVFGSDLLRRSGATVVLVDRPRAYHLLHDLDPEAHELRLAFAEPGLTFYAFSFSPCVSAAPEPRSSPC